MRLDHVLLPAQSVIAKSGYLGMQHDSQKSTLSTGLSLKGTTRVEEVKGKLTELMKVDVLRWDMLGVGRGHAYRHARMNPREWELTVGEVTHNLAYASDDRLIVQGVDNL